MKKFIIMIAILLLALLLLIIGIQNFYPSIDYKFKKQFTDESKELLQVSFLSKCKWDFESYSNFPTTSGPDFLCIVEINDKKTISSDKEKIVRELTNLGWQVGDTEGFDLSASKNGASVYFDFSSCSANVSEYSYCLSYVKLK